ncbi:OmpP1/FadL family transporter [Hydrogenivirga caldilitoris]|nr:OmpP1/FadL family transporter [Hydrogenivirga caldilitoris]
MKKVLTGVFAISLASEIALAGGYKIPEQSLRSTGTAGAYFSSANAPDAAYFNPANMSFMKDGWGLEVGMRYIVLPSIDFSGRTLDPATTSFTANQNFSSEKESFLAPYFHYVSPKVGKLRFGLSFTTPGGLSKKWEGNIAQAYAKNFHLEVYEASLSASYEITESISVGGGLRGVYSRGEVEFAHPGGGYSISMDGDTAIKPGLFISASVKPTKELTISTLYRSKVDLKIKGDASGYFVTNPGPPPTIYSFDTSGNVKIPLPAEWRLGASYKWNKTTFELTYERTFWSDYEKLDFNFGDPNVEGSSFGEAKPKDWKDTNTYRFAVLHEFNDKLTGMAGIAYDETPVPERTLGFELPDSDGWILSAGGIYKPEPKVEIGVAYLYFMKKDRSVNNDRIQGKFKDISAHMLTLSIGYSF